MRPVLVVGDETYICCFHCNCPTPDGHAAPCVRCAQPPRVTRDRMVARAMNRNLPGGGVNGEIRSAKDALKDGPLSPSGVPAPPPPVSWSDRSDAAAPARPRGWWDPRSAVGASA